MEHHHIRFPEGHDYEDNAFWYMYSITAKSVFFFKKPLYHYFLRQGSIMSAQVGKKPKNKMDGVAVAEYILDFLTKNNLQHKKTYLMAQIFRRLLKGARKFFTPQEIDNLCQEINKQLSSNYEIVYSQSSDRLTLKKKNRLQLFYKKLCDIFNKNIHKKTPSE